MHGEEQNGRGKIDFTSRYRIRFLGKICKEVYKSPLVTEA